MERTGEGRGKEGREREELFIRRARLGLKEVLLHRKFEVNLDYIKIGPKEPSKIIN